MATIKVYHEETDRYYSIQVNLISNYLSDGDGSIDYYVLVTTDMKDTYGNALPRFIVRSLADNPLPLVPVTNFTGLINNFISWYMIQAELGQSSSSSSTSSVSSSSISSNSSSSTSSTSESSSSSVSSVSESSSSSSSSSRI